MAWEVIPSTSKEEVEIDQQVSAIVSEESPKLWIATHVIAAFNERPRLLALQTSKRRLEAACLFDWMGPLPVW
jgi:hypothetical protein